MTGTAAHPTPLGDRAVMHAELLAMLELDALLADWAIPDPREVPRGTDKKEIR